MMGWGTTFTGYASRISKGDAVGKELDAIERLEELELELVALWSMAQSFEENTEDYQFAPHVESAKCARAMFESIVEAAKEQQICRFIINDDNAKED
jgi:hypothetical protein